MHAIFSDSTFGMTMYVSLCGYMKRNNFKLKVGRCFALISNHFLLIERSLSFNNVMITLTNARLSARTVELASGAMYYNHSSMRKVHLYKPCSY